MTEYSPKCNIDPTLKPYLLPGSANCRHKLDIIENLFEVHPDVKNLNPGNINIYPRAAQYEQLKIAISNYVNTNPDNIIITAGSDNAIKLIVDTFINQTTKVLCPIPTYPHAQHFFKLTGCDLIYCGYDNMKRHEHDFSVAYIVSPGIVYGNITSLETIEHLCRGSRIIVIDEAYIEFSDAESAVKLVDKYPNLIVVRTFSKAFSLAGLRLGYIVTSKPNIDLLTISHNPKTVTQIAMSAGQLSLKNLPFYKNIWSQFEDEKVYLRAELDGIVSLDAPITGYNISHGNFYLLRCQDTALVTRQFSECLIDVRDKHADAPNYIRISIGTHPINLDVIRICRRINLKHVIGTCGELVIDLDNTLRNGAKLTDRLLIDNSLIPQLQSLLSHSHIVTNNPTDPAVIADYFAKKHILVHHDRVHTSLSALKNYLYEWHNNDVMLICDDDTRKYLTDGGVSSDYSAVAIINNFYSLNLGDIIKISEIVHRGCPILITDSSLDCTRKNCADDTLPHDEIYDGDLIIPDLASVCKMFESIGAKIICVGKPSLFCLSSIIIGNNTRIEFVIGDSNSDYELAKRLKCEFIHVDSNSQLLYDWKKDCHCIRGISDIL